MADYSGENNGMFGKKHSKESKEKMAEKKRGGTSWNLGIPRDNETISKISKTKMENPSHVPLVSCLICGLEMKVTGFKKHYNSKKCSCNQR